MRTGSGGTSASTPSTDRAKVVAARCRREAASRRPARSTERSPGTNGAGRRSNSRVGVGQRAAGSRPARALAPPVRPAPRPGGSPGRRASAPTRRPDARRRPTRPRPDGVLRRTEASSSRTASPSSRWRTTRPRASARLRSDASRAPLQIADLTRSAASLPVASASASATARSSSSQPAGRLRASQPAAPISSGVVDASTRRRKSSSPSRTRWTAASAGPVSFWKLEVADQLLGCGHRRRRRHSLAGHLERPLQGRADGGGVHAGPIRSRPR